ncbi:MAG: SRPBCC domain-containing protein [Bacteroidota bacterium]
MEKRNDSFRWENNVIEHKRFLKAPRSLVWEVWTKPEHLAKWYGPEGYTLTTAQLQLQTGGAWNFVMHGFGKDYQKDIRYTRIEPEHTLCFRNGAIGNPYGFDVQVTLEEQEGGTWLTMRSEFSSKAVIEELNQKVNAIEGGKQTLNKLVAYAEKLFSGN